MIVTKIQVNKKDKNKVDIHFDNDTTATLLTEIAVKHHIEVGMPFSEIMISRFTHEGNIIECSKKATQYVSKGLKTAHQVEIYLIKQGYDSFEINQSIKKLQEYNLIDDVAYMKAYIHDHKDYGKKMLKQELYKKGIKWNTICEYFKNNYQLDLKHLQKMADKYLKNKEHKLINMYACQRYLLSKGFEYEDIQQVDWSNYEGWDPYVGN